jgi:hypothetical protein
MLRRSFRPLRPEFDKFLFATVGDEVDGIPISVVSALARLGLDPREEAGRLSSLGNREAVEQLARLIAEVPGSFRPLGEARLLADGLVGLLPKHGTSRTSALQVQFVRVMKRLHYRSRPNFGLSALSSRQRRWSALWFTAGFRSVSGARKWEAKKPPPFGEAQIYRG